MARILNTNSSADDDQSEMSLVTFFLDEQVIADESDSVFALELEDSDMKHAHALRLRSGEKIAVIDASADYFVCEIRSIGRDFLEVSISETDGMREADINGKVHLFHGLPKSDKFDDVIRQGTEIGVQAFFPFVSERTVPRLSAEKAGRRADRWRKIAKSAAMQSGRRSIPEVGTLMDLEDALAELASYDLVILFWEEAGTSCRTIDDLAGLCPAGGKAAVVVGPEGGFSESEVDRITSSASTAHCCSLGNTILRTETAAVVGCALVIHALGGLGGTRCDSAGSVRA